MEVICEAIKVDITNTVSVDREIVQGLSPPTLWYIEVGEMKNNHQRRQEWESRSRNTIMNNNNNTEEIKQKK